MSIARRLGAAVGLNILQSQRQQARSLHSSFPTPRFWDLLNSTALETPKPQVNNPRSYEFLREDVVMPLKCLFPSKLDVPMERVVSSLHRCRQNADFDVHREARQLIEGSKPVLKTRVGVIPNPYYSHIIKSHFSTTAQRDLHSSPLDLKNCNKGSSGGSCGKDEKKPECGNKSCEIPKKPSCGGKPLEEKKKENEKPCGKVSAGSQSPMRSFLQTVAPVNLQARTFETGGPLGNDAKCPKSAKRSKKDLDKEREEIIQKEYKAIHDCLNSRKCVKPSDNRKKDK